jgi:AraC-like DNA-binding protein
MKENKFFLRAGENPSHFAQLFLRETGLAPSDYCRQRWPPAAAANFFNATLV